MPTIHWPDWLGQFFTLGAFLTANQPHLSSFVEACFGINTLLGVYADLRSRWVNRIEVHIGGVVAKIKALEVNGDPEVLTIMKTSVESIQAGHSSWQGTFCIWCRNASLTFAILCLCVLFFNGFAYWNIFLVLPFPTFFLVSYLSSWWCVHRINRREAVDKDFLTRFKILPSDIPVSSLIIEKTDSVQSAPRSNEKAALAAAPSQTKKKKPPQKY